MGHNSKSFASKNFIEIVRLNTLNIKALKNIGIFTVYYFNVIVVSFMAI